MKSLLKISSLSAKCLNLLPMAAFSAARKFLFFFGAPGVGKGTFAERLARDLKFNKISTGDELRKIIKSQASSTMDESLVAKVKGIVSSGKLVSDDIIMAIIAEKLNEPESKYGVIFDGFPRTLGQLKKYEEKYPTHLVFNITLNFEILMEKLLGRRTCVSCGRAYNICSINKNGYEMKPLLPKEEDKCDDCGDKLIQRSDDNEEVIAKRMKEYEAKTLPLLEEYQKKGVVFEFEPKKGVQDYPLFLEQVKPLIEKIE